MSTRAAAASAARADSCWAGTNGAPAIRTRSYAGQSAGRRGISRAGGIVLGWHDRGLSDQEPKLRRDVSRLRRAKPFWPRSGWVFDLQVQANANQDRHQDKVA